jgi:hypothetical protein
MRGVEWALPRLQAGGRLYTHCEHGVGRGPLMGLAVMVAQGAEATAAYRALRQVRWQCTLNDRQLNGLSDFVTAWGVRAPGHQASGQRSGQRTSSVS